MTLLWRLYEISERAVFIVLSKFFSNSECQYSLELNKNLNFWLQIDLAALGLPAPPEDMPEIDVLTPCCSQIDMFSFGLISFPTLPKPTPHVDL
ncbi:Hypothetical predicted protein [Cloeon dipterum]|uniref:Uncharacterized protein n=1 Tax=Cloeon dipterum TaxID=197152 RepID=A0A8S1DNI3_9INSE|nr:Hypothetical predicted protein [Cloeon dipterum]